MTLTRLALYLGVCAISTVTLPAQYLVTFQGPTAVSQDPTVSFFDPVTLAPGATIQVPGAFQFLSRSDGSELYFITNNAGSAITVLHPKSRSAVAAVAGRHDIGNFGNPLNCAALSPDGSRLVVGENLVHIFDTGTNLDLTPNGIALGDGATVVGVAVSYDSQTAYALATYNGSSYLAAISIPQLAVTNTVNITGAVMALALGPNGLLYVSCPNQILEINPATLTTTPGGVVPVNATPGPLVFTPDGNYAAVANQVFGAQPAIVLVNLNDHQVEGSVPFTGLTALQSSPLTGLPATFDGLYVASPATIYAFSSAAQSLFDLQVGTNGGLALEIPVIPSVNLGAQAAAALSNDLGLPGRNYPQYLFTVSSGTIDGTGINNLYRIDPASSLLTQQVPLYSYPAAVAYFSPTFNPSGTPTTGLIYGNNQNLLPGGTTLPLVVRVLDQNGLPIAGLGVSFTTGSGTGKVVPANTVTGADGYAQTIFTAGSTPADIGAISIVATIESLQEAFNVNVGTGQTATVAALNIVSGQGQVILENPATGELPEIAPFTVAAVDASGAPVPNTLVTFSMTSGVGGLTAPDGSQQNVVVVPTDSTGQASIFFTPTLVTSYRGFQQAVVTASAPTAALDSNSNPVPITTSFTLTTLPLDISYCGVPPCNPPISPLYAQILQPAPGTVLSGTAGSTLPNPVVVQVYSVSGPAVPNIGVQLSTGSNPGVPSASCAGTAGGLALTDTNGLATCNVVLNGIPGTKPLTISIPEAGLGNGTGLVFGGYTLTILPGAATTISVLSGDNQVVLPNTSLPAPFLVKVLDAFGNPVPGAPVSWQVLSGSIILSGASTLTTVTGEAIASGYVTSPGGSTVTLQISVGSATATFTILVSVPAATVKIVSGNNQSALINTPFTDPLVVQLQDSSGNPASFAQVAFNASGIATVNPGQITADVNGQASTMVTAGPIAGTLKVSAISGGGKSPPTATFTLTTLPLGPTGPAILNAASFTASIAPGVLVALTGAGLTPTIQGVVTDPTQMDGYAVSFDGIPAPILALVNQNGNQQINLQLPFEESPGSSDSITIQTPLGSATVSNVTVNPFAPGIFIGGTLDAYGQSFPLAVATRPDGSYVSAANPVQRGENMTFFATGLGQTVPNASTGIPGLPGQIVGSLLYAGVNNQGDAVVSAIYEPGVVGVYAVTIKVPADTTPGPVQPLGLFMVDLSGTGYTAQPAYVPIQ